MLEPFVPRLVAHAIITIKVVAWGLAVYGLWFILGNTAYLFELGLQHPLILSKIRFDAHWQTLYYWALWPHILSGIVCLVILLIQLPVTRWLGHGFAANVIHRYSGRLYVVMVCAVLCPTGGLMVPSVPGGLWNQLGFLSMGLGLFASTVFAVYAIVCGKIASHQRWMLRSASFLFIAISFRFIQWTIAYMGVPLDVLYVTATWLSIGLNVIGIELWLNRNHLSHWISRMLTTNKIESIKI